jgi:hypothetical protein
MKDTKLRHALPAVLALLVLALVAALPAAAPAPAQAQEPPPEPAPAPASGMDDLRKEYDRIREALFASRARAAAVGAAVYTAKLQIYLHYGTPRFYHVSRAAVRVDGASVWEDTQGTVGADDALRFEGFVAPGKHQVTVRLESEAKDDTSFTSTSEESFVIDVPARRLVILRAQAVDNGDMGFAWGKHQKGSYKLHLDAEVEAKAMANATPEKK